MPSRSMLCIVQQATCVARQLPPDEPNKCPSVTRHVSTTAADWRAGASKAGHVLAAVALALPAAYRHGVLNEGACVGLALVKLQIHLVQHRHTELGGAGAEIGTGCTRCHTDSSWCPMAIQADSERDSALRRELGRLINHQDLSLCLTCAAAPKHQIRCSPVALRARQIFERSFTLMPALCQATTPQLTASQRSR